jgi:hypothetical protein
MRSRWTVRVGGCALLAAAVAVPPAPVRAGQPASLNRRDAAAVERAREGAAGRLAEAGCRRVLSDFHDARGRTLERVLEDWALSPAAYLRVLPFVDGSGELLCQRGKVMLASTPRVPRVLVCPGFARLGWDEPEVAESLVIHEMLHTLGLGEDPPSSMEITRRVEARCR